MQLRKKNGIATALPESATEVTRQREKVNECIYRYLLVRALAHDSLQALHRAIEALNGGDDYDEVNRTIRDYSETPGDADSFLKVMVTERNRAWMPKLMAYIDQGSAVVNVGAAHLSGPESLISLLRSNSYKVDPIHLQERNLRSSRIAQ